MLLVAIPKSASTSLMTTLGRIHDLPSEQVELRDLVRPPGIRNLHRHHPDIVELDGPTVERLVGPGHLYKQHIPPTANNVARLADHRIVVLLRDPDVVVDAYLRAFKSFAMKPVGVDRTIDMESWRSHAEQVGLRDDVDFFHRGWRAAAARGNVLLVEFDDLTAEPKRVLNDIERHLGLTVTGSEVELSRQRYTHSRLLMVKRIAGRATRRLGVHRHLIRVLRLLRLHPET